MIPHRRPLVPAIAAFSVALLMVGCGGGGGDKTKTAAPSSAVTSAVTAAATTTPSLGIREIDLAKVADVEAVLAGTGGEYLPASVIYADLTEDGSDEAIVPISSGGTMGDVAFLVLTPDGDGTATLLKELPLNQEGGLSVAIADGQLVMTQALYGPEDPNCCPSMLRKTTYVWNGTSLAVQTVKTEVNPAGGGKTTPVPTP
jgi:hypothetical protein